jgi:predicted transcriptional regulator
METNNIRTQNPSSSSLAPEKHASLVDMLRGLEERCKNCNPLTPIICMTECKTWKLKNELRKINERMQRPNFVERLLNTLKNGRRLQILDLISRQDCSISRLQQKLMTLGYHHSKQTIVEEYVNPLVEVGLVEEAQSPYRATVLGRRVNELVKNSYDLQDILPPHSECYEETTLDALLERPRTYRDTRMIVPTKTVARVLSRLQRTGLVETSEEKNYIFIFKTRRDSNLETFSPTESRVYKNIPPNGISAKKLSENTGISLRRTYKYLRKLKGKKLVFTRKEPLAYSLTDKGARVATMLRAIRNLKSETQAMTAQLLKDEKDEEMTERTGPKTDCTRKKGEETMTLTDRSYAQSH